MTSTFKSACYHPKGGASNAQCNEYLMHSGGEWDAQVRGPCSACTHPACICACHAAGIGAATGSMLRCRGGVCGRDGTRVRRHARPYLGGHRS